MKSPGVIYRQFRLLKHNRLKKELQEKLARCPQNCSSWRELSIKDEKGKPYRVPMCFFRQPEKGPLNTKELLVCSTVENAKQCNAFTPRHTKEQIEKDFEHSLLDPKQTNAKYPELYSFIWILDRDLYEAQKEPGMLSRAILSLIQTLERCLKTIQKWKKSSAPPTEELSS
jgi:hypothetical protein